MKCHEKSKKIAGKLKKMSYSFVVSFVFCNFALNEIKTAQKSLITVVTKVFLHFP